MISTSSISNVAYTQTISYQKAQAERTADTAARNAAVMQKEANQASHKAEQAYETANSLQIKAEQANSNALTAQQNVRTLNNIKSAPVNVKKETNNNIGKNINTTA